MTPVAEPRILTATHEDLPEVAALVAESFFALAPSQWLVADAEERRRIFPDYFRIYVDYAFEHGFIDIVEDRCAAAVWIELGEGGHEPDPTGEKRLAAVAGPHMERFNAFDALLEAAHPTGRRHNHLALLAVRPDRQRAGLGTALLRHRHGKFDEAAQPIPAYLEASDAGTRTVYLKHGYRDLGEPIHLPGGPLMFPMWREPTPV